MIWVEKLVAAVVVVVAAIAGVNATHVYAGPISYTGDAYTENFESLGWLTYPSQTAWVNGVTLSGWYASNAQYLKGSIGYAVPYSDRYLFSYRSGADSAIGSQNGLSGVPSVSFGVQIVNNTVMVLPEFTLSYFGEQWSMSGDDYLQQLSFHYGLNAHSLTSGEYVRVSALDFVSPSHKNTYPYGGDAIDGNLPENRTRISATVTGLNWMPGDSLWLRWTDIDEESWWYGAALAIDDLVFTTTEFATPPIETASLGLATAQAPMSISEPSTAWLAGLCIAALAIVTRCPKKHVARTEAARRVLTQ